MSIEDLAEQLAIQLVESNPTLPEGPWVDRAHAITTLFGSGGPGNALRTAIEGDPSFGDLRGGWIGLPSGVGRRIQPADIARQLVDGVILGSPAGSLVNDVRHFAASPTSSTEYYTPIAGATVAQVIDLGDNLQLVPWADVPEVDQKKIFDVDGPNIDFLASIPVVSPDRAPANLAARVRSSESRVLFASHQEAQEALVASTTAVSERAARIRDVVRCITLHGQQCAAELGGWSLPDNEFVRYLVGTAYHSYGNLYDSNVYRATRTPVALDPESFVRLFRCFEGFNGADIDSLRVCADRLNQALRQSNAVSKAIDLGIAIESLLLHGIGPRDRGELKYRLSVRGATFFGGSKEERLSTFNLLRAAYDLRSQAVHTGALSTKKRAPSPTETLEEAASTCLRIAKQLIERGSFPDWEADCVFGE